MKNTRTNGLDTNNNLQQLKPYVGKCKDLKCTNGVVQVKRKYGEFDRKIIII